MSALSQKTIKNSVSIKGIGLHTGELVRIKINPAEPNTGIIFKRIEIMFFINQIYLLIVCFLQFMLGF